RARFHVLVLRRALCAGIQWTMKIVAVANSQPIIDRQHQVTATGEVLVRCVCVCVIVRIVPAQEHLSWWSTVNVNDRRLLRRTALGFKQLSVNLDSVRRLEDDLLRDQQLRRRKITRNTILCECHWFTAAGSYHGW